MTDIDLMKLLHRLEAQSRRDFFPPPEEAAAQHGDTQPTPPNFPMHHGRGRMISVLSRHAGITQKELSERLAIRPQSLSDALAKLESDGVIYRERSPEDKRELRLYLTDAGQKMAEDINRRREERAKEFFSALSPAEKETFFELLTKLCSANENK